MCVQMHISVCMYVGGCVCVCVFMCVYTCILPWIMVGILMLKDMCTSAHRCALVCVCVYVYSVCRYARMHIGA